MASDPIEKALGGSLVETVIRAVVGARKATMGAESLTKQLTNAQLMVEIHRALPDEAKQLTQRIKDMPTCPEWLRALL